VQRRDGGESIEISLLERAAMGTSGGNRGLSHRQSTFRRRGSQLGVTGSRLPQSEPILELTGTDVIQRSLTWGHHNAAHAILLNSPLTPPTTAARLRGVGGHPSHLWLTTLP